jgi:hypothetical protein
MSSTISGNVGGAAAVGAQVQIRDIQNNKIKFAAADGSGNYSIPGLAATTHIVSATLSANVYYHPVQVVTDGVSTYTDINLNPTALNAQNAPVQQGNY